MRFFRGFHEKSKKSVNTQRNIFINHTYDLLSLTSNFHWCKFIVVTPVQYHNALDEESYFTDHR